MEAIDESQKRLWQLAQAAAEQLANFANGVYFVSLTGVGTPNLVASAIASALEISFYGPDAPGLTLIKVSLDTAPHR